MKKKIATFVILFSFNLYVYADVSYLPGNGEIFSTSLSGNATIQVEQGSQGNWICSQPYTAGIVNAQSASGIPADNFGTTSDGVFGLKYLPWPQSDTVITLQGSTKTNRVSGATGAGIVSNLSINWIDGKPLSPPSIYNECLNSYPWNLTPFESAGFSNRGNGSTTSDLKVSVYIGPSANSGKYTPIYPILNYFVRDATRRISSASLPVINIKTPLNCAINQPTLVNFGVVNQNITGMLLSSHQDNLNIRCQGDYSSNLKISFSYNSDGLISKNEIPLKNNDNKTMAVIRGHYGDSFSQTCSSYDNNDVLFDGSVSQIKNNIGSGTLTTPITWSLCRYGSELYTGKGSAQATMIIDWE